MTHPLGILTQRVPLDAGTPYGVAISGTGVVYVTTGSGRAYRGDVATRTFGPPLVIDQLALDVGFTRDEDVVVVAHQNSFAGPITLIDPATHSVTGVIPTPYGVASIARDPAGDRTFFGFANSASAYELKRVPDGGFFPSPGNPISGFEGRVLTMPVGGGGIALAGLAFDPSRQLLYATATNGFLGGRFFPDGGTTTAIGLGGTQGARGTVYDPARDRLYIANETGGLFNLQFPSFAQVPGTPIAAANHWGAAITPDGTELWLTRAQDGGALTIFNLLNFTARAVPVSGRLRRIAFDATGRNAVITNEDGEVLFFQ